MNTHNIIEAIEQVIIPFKSAELTAKKDIDNAILGDRCKLFNDLEEKGKIPFFGGCQVRKFLHTEGQLIVLLDEAGQFLDIAKISDGNEDYTVVAKQFMNSLFIHLGKMTLVLNQFGEKSTVYNGDAKTFRRAIYIIVRSFDELGGYFQIADSDERKDIFEATFKALKSGKIRDIDSLKSTSARALFNKITEHLINKYNEENEDE